MNSLAAIDRSWYSVPIALAVGLGTVTFAPLPTDQAVILGITSFCIVFWIGNPIPPSFTGLLGIGLIVLTFSPSLALGGFSEPVLWVIVFGLIIGEAIHQSRLAAVFERRVLQWIATDLVGDGGDRPDTSRDVTDAMIDPVRVYRRLLVALCLGGLLFALMIPSSLVRVLILAPILIEIGGIFESRDARLGLLFGPLFSTFYGGVGILTAALPNIVIVGIVESITGTSISWTQWFLSLFPVMGLGRTLLVAGLMYLLYRPDPDSEMTIKTGVGDTDSTELRRTAAFLLVGVAIWATDFIHGLHPVFGALVVAVLLLLPRIGTVSFDAVGDVDFSIVFFVGAVFAIATGLSRTGFTDLATNYLLSFVPMDASLPITLLAVFGITTLLMFAIEGVAASSVLTPILVSFATEVGLPLEPIVLIEAIALGHYFFPHQSIVLVAILSYDVVEPAELIRVTSILSVATIVILLPLQLLYFLYL